MLRHPLLLCVLTFAIGLAIGGFGRPSATAGTVSAPATVAAPATVRPAAPTSTARPAPTAGRPAALPPAVQPAQSGSDAGTTGPAGGVDPRAFVETFDGKPSGPQPFRTSGRWDVQVHARDDLHRLMDTPRQHGMDCGAPPASHVDTSYEGAVFLCRDHLMTAIDGHGYALTMLTPNQQLSWSEGEGVVKVDVSTFRSSARDWWDIWLTPYDEHMALVVDDIAADLQGQPRRAIQIKMDAFLKTLCVTRYVDHEPAAELDNECGTSYEEAPSFPGESATRRDTFELRITRDRLTATMPAYGHTFFSVPLRDLGYDRALVQFGHHGYTPEKGCLIAEPETVSCGNTWHWDNVVISPAVPFTIIPGNRRFVDATTGTDNVVRFERGAPDGARLRFTGTGDLEVSVDGGGSWQAAKRAIEEKDDIGVKNYLHPVPTGTSQVLLRGTDNALPWQAKDFAIWSQAQP